MTKKLSTQQINELMEKNYYPVESRSIRPNGKTRIVYDYSETASMTDPTDANLSDINFLMKKYKPDELELYLASRQQGRQAIEGYDFSKEPDINTAMNEVYRLKQAFEKLPDDVRIHFKNAAEFMKFANDPRSYEKLKKLGLITETQSETKTNNDAIKRDDKKQTSESTGSENPKT